MFITTSVLTSVPGKRTGILQSCLPGTQNTAHAICVDHRIFLKITYFEERFFEMNVFPGARLKVIQRWLRWWICAISRLVLSEPMKIPQVNNSNMMTSSNRNIFRVTSHLCGEFIGHVWIRDQYEGPTSTGIDADASNGKSWPGYSWEQSGLMFKMWDIGFISTLCHCYFSAIMPNLHVVIPMESDGP